MNITFNNTKEIFIRKDLTEFKTVKLQKAIIPFAWYNVKQSYKNNFFDYYIIDVKTKVMQNSGSITILDGYYTVDTFNAAIQEKLKEIGYDNAIEINYLENQGRIRIRQKKEEFVASFHEEFRHFLGLNDDPDRRGVFTREEETGTTSSIFFDNQYKIYCNIIDSSKNIVNGDESELLATFTPKIEKYGVSQMFKTNKSCAIENYNYTHIKIDIKDRDENTIDFHLPFIIELKLE